MWYEQDPELLRKSLDDIFLSIPRESIIAPIKNQKIKSIIVPHAGYVYSGKTACYAYKNLNMNEIKKIFILGPSHFTSFNGCGLTRKKSFSTPLGDIKCDEDIIDELYKTKEFQWLNPDVESKEHSIMNQLPIIKYIMEKQKIKDENIKIIPLMIGDIDDPMGDKYAMILSKYFKDPENLFIISSDFCHWGKRFNYFPLNSKYDHDFMKSITELDKLGMKTITSMHTDQFEDYLKHTGNTICGRNGIILLLKIIEICNNYRGVQLIDQMQFEMKVLNYSQSNIIKSFNDSMVSYYSVMILIRFIN